jgi:two-component system, chemotaxis family, chemotaxis protein CheY
MPIEPMADPEVKTPHVLIVDDSPTMRRMVMTSLKGLGDVKFWEAGNGLEAIERLALMSVDLMILDLNMPEMHGLEVLQFVRAHKTYRDLPVVVLTTREDQASREEAAASGATDYLTKPFQARELLAHARKLLAEE